MQGLTSYYLIATRYWANVTGDLRSSSSRSSNTSGSVSVASTTKCVCTITYNSAARVKSLVKVDACLLLTFKAKDFDRVRVNKSHCSARSNQIHDTYSNNPILCACACVCVCVLRGQLWARTRVSNNITDKSGSRSSSRSRSSRNLAVSCRRCQWWRPKLSKFVLCIHFVDKIYVRLDLNWFILPFLYSSSTWQFFFFWQLALLQG